MLPTQIKDRNGNYIDIFYKSLSNNDTVIDYVIDTLSRRIDFTYQNDRLIDVRQTRDTGVFKFVILDYTPVTISTGFSQTDPATINDTVVYLPHKLTYPNGSSLKFYYTSYGQIHLMEKWVPGVAEQGATRRVGYTRVNAPSINQVSFPSTSLLPEQDFFTDDCPDFDKRFEQAENWSSGVEQDFYYSSWDINGGAVYEVEEPLIWVNGQLVSGRKFRWTITNTGLNHELMISQNVTTYKWDTTKFMKDTGVSYVSNARPQEHSVSDGTNTRKEKYTYTQSNGVWLATQKDEYNNGASTVYRRTTDVGTHFVKERVRTS